MPKKIIVIFLVSILFLLITACGKDSNKTDSFILIEHNKAFAKSSAALRTTKHLNRLYPLLYTLLIVPPFIRNSVYDYIAKNRYKWFGRTESCRVPTPELKAKFIS